ncbi:YcaO-like family protein [Psychromicrobium silvestre]|nr:YcaO-like family protein [Psychromicrobium silvestre]
MFQEREVVDQLSMARPNPLRSGIIGPDLGLIPAVQPIRVRPGWINAPALVVHGPRLPSFVGANLPSQSSTGFGLGAEQLFGSACGEFIERYSAGILPTSNIKFPASEKIPAKEFQQFTSEQYSSSEFPYVPPESLERLPYTRAFGALDHRPVAVPADLVHLNPSSERQWCTITSSGLAAGRNYGMAARAAIFELIERDAFMCAWYGRRSGVCLSLPENVPTHFSAELRGICRQLELLGVTITLVRFEGVGGVPVVLSCARSASVGLAVGCSAKADIRAAMTAAFIESVHTHNWAHRMREETPDISAINDLEDHIAFHAQAANRNTNSFLDSGPAVSEADFIADGGYGLAETLEAAERAGWDIWLADVRSRDVAAQGWHVIRALSPQAATLDVDEPHLRQHPGALHTTPHPFP